MHYNSGSELCLPALVICDTTLRRRDALVVTSVCAQLIAKLDVSTLELVLSHGVDTSIVGIIGAGGTGLGLVGVEVLLGLLGDLLVVGHFDVFVMWEDLKKGRTCCLVAIDEIDLFEDDELLFFTAWDLYYL